MALVLAAAQLVAALTFVATSATAQTDDARRAAGEAEIPACAHARPRRHPSFLFEVKQRTGETREKHWQTFRSEKQRDNPLGVQHPIYALIDTYENDYVASDACRIALRLEAATNDERLEMHESARTSLFDALVIAQRLGDPIVRNRSEALLYAHIGGTYAAEGREAESLAAHTRSLARIRRIPARVRAERSLDVVFVAHARSLLSFRRFREFDAAVKIAEQRTNQLRTEPALRASLLSLKASAWDQRGRTELARPLHQAAMGASSTTEVVINWARHLIVAGDDEVAQAVLLTELNARSQGAADPAVQHLYAIVVGRRKDATSGAVQAEFATSLLGRHARDARHRWVWPGPEFAESHEGLTYAIESSVHDASDPRRRTAFTSHHLQLAWQGFGSDPLNADRLVRNAFMAIQRHDRSEAAEAVARSAAYAAAQAGNSTERGRRFLDLTTLIASQTRAIDAAIRGQVGGLASLVTARAEAARSLAHVTSRITSDLLESSPDGPDRFFTTFFKEDLGVEQVQARLAPDQGLLLLTPVGDDVYVFAVGKRKLSWVRLAGAAAPVAERVQTLRCDLDPANCGSAAQGRVRAAASGYGDGRGLVSSRPFDRDAAFQLYQSLIAPVEDALSGARRVYVVANGALGTLPLGVLLTARPGPSEHPGPGALAQASWLADRYALTTLPSVSSLNLVATPSSTPGARTPFRGFGDPRLGVSETASLAPGSRRGAVGGLHAGLTSLPGTRAELVAMAETLGAGPQALRLGGEATELAVRDATDLADAEVVAFATHGLVAGEVEGLDEPALVLTPPRRPSPLDDGLLTASEAAQLRLSADWVILSACNTAAGGASTSAETLSGLARAFLFAGARALMVSHWRVQDDVAAALTTETILIRRRDPALSKAQSLQQAMASVRRGRRPDGSAVGGWTSAWAHPSAWGPFVVVSAAD